MRRRLLVGIGTVLTLAAVAYVTAWAAGAHPAEAIGGLVLDARPPIVVGLLHSQTGPLAISEKSLIDAELMAVEEVNARGGVAGRRLVARVADGRSEPSAFAAEARRLIDAEGARVIFGGYTSEGRAAVRAAVEERRSLLVVPGNYEGMEPPGRVIHAGGSANQTVVPAVRWCVDELKARRFYVAGTDGAWSRSVSEIAKDSIKAAGAELAGESYLPPGARDAEAMASAIRGAGPDVVLSSVEGDSNVPFYAALRRSGLTPDRVPVLSYSVSEDELRRIPPGDVAGHYSAWNYFQSVDREENRDFVRRFRARYGPDRVTCDAIVAAYDGVLLWAQAADEARTAEPQAVLEHLGRQSLDAPDGIVTIDPVSGVLWRPCRVGRARADGQFDVAWSLEKPIHPLTFIATRTRSEWLSFAGGLRARGGVPRPPAGAASPRPGEK